MCMGRLFRKKKALGEGHRPNRLTLPLALEQGRAPRLLNHLLYLASGFVLAVVIWASVTEIKELAVAEGQVIPAGSQKLVQHLEGGVVAEILVAEGEVVEQGAALVRMQPTAAGSDLARLTVRAASLMMQTIRLDAQIDGSEPDFGQMGRNYPEFKRDQIQVLRTQRLNLEKERETLMARIEKSDAEVRAAAGQLESLKLQVEIQREQLEIREGLLKDGLVSRTRYLEARKLYETARTSRIAMQGQMAAAREILKEARGALRELESKRKRELTDERAKVGAELAELSEAIAKHKDRVTRLMVRAPVRGVVQELVPKSVGEVVKSGDVVARVVPLTGELVAEVRIQPKDIGHVRPGFPAEVKVTTYDPARFGAIKGEVRRISPTTFQTQEGEPYYKAIVQLEKTYVGLDDQEHLVLPGMVVHAEIITGAKSLTRYLLKPVYRSLDIAFTER